jgi:hypothetical protein
MQPILAYIDPGSGSLVVQVLIASVLAIPFFLRTQIRQGVAILRGARRPRSHESPDDLSKV